MKKSFYFFIALLLFIISSTVLLSCKSKQTDDCFKGLTSDERKLIKKIMKDMNSNKKSLGLVNENSKTYKYVNFFYAGKPFNRIKKTYADMLSRNYDFKRKFIELARRDQMRGNNGKAEDTRSVWIPTDEILLFIAELVNYEAATDTLTGINIVFGSYPYEKVKDDMTDPVTGARIHSDTLSGRTTLYFVGTADTTNLKDYNVKRHKIIENFITGYGMKTAGGGKYYNHGSLCPDSCTAN
jgi:hypothetical protein